MFLFAHMGIGEAISKPFSRGFKRRWILVGTLLPDLIDKPLYYSLSLATGLNGPDLGLISGTRTFGHTAIFLAALMLLAYFRKSRTVAALALGCATHLLLDAISDSWLPHDVGKATMINALLFPWDGARFPVYPFQGVSEHLKSFQRGPLIFAEILGLLFFIWETWKHLHTGEILLRLREKRLKLKLKRSKRR